MTVVSAERIDPANQTRLDGLAVTVRREYAGVLRSGREAVEHAIHCGEALLEARSLIPHGLWTAWLRDNVDVSYGTAVVHMRLARHKDLVQQHGDLDSITAALAVLRDEHMFPARSLTDSDRHRMRELREAGHKLSEIAVIYDVSESTVCRWTTGRASRATREIEPAATRVPITDDMIERMALWMNRNLFAGKRKIDDQLRHLALRALHSVLAPGAFDRRLR